MTGTRNVAVRKHFPKSSSLYGYTKVSKRNMGCKMLRILKNAMVSARQKV